MKCKYKTTSILSILVVAISFVSGCGNDSSTQTSTPNNSSSQSSSTSSNNNVTTEKPVYTKEQLERDSRAPSKDPADYNKNGEYEPKNGVSRNPADYNAKGEYKPVESMTQEEKRKELEEMLKNH